MPSTHYEKSTSTLEAYYSAVDRERRNPDYERDLLAVALIEAVLDVSTQLAAIRDILNRA